MRLLQICLLSGKHFAETFENAQLVEKSQKCNQCKYEEPNKCNLCDFAFFRACYLRIHLKNILEKIQKSVTSVTLHPSRQTIMATKKESQINATIANMPSLRQAI